ncbi:MAG: LacI family DNA-binding transcriptional regulator [Acidobacteria bacterium]|nr:LacI family DNA-binding transcriptional regulator [Acidobacteriota bacterium]
MVPGDSTRQVDCTRVQNLKPVSIKDIARRANVSHSTVSRALQNSPLVNRETADKIRRLARELDYRASAVARSLATSKTRSAGVVVTSIADPFAAGVVGGIEDAANQHGYSIVLANSHADPEREMAVVRSLEERRVDGVVVTASRVGAMYVPLLARMRVPIVLLNNQHPSEFAHSVMIANLEASRDATRHLIQLGHRRIAYLGDRYGHQSDTERFGGYRQALDEADVPFQPELVVHGDGKPEGGMQAMERLLALAVPPTAVFCYNDMTALGALRRIRASGLRVPGDISLVGFDDLYIAEYTDPPLTTVRQPLGQMGRLAMEALIRLLEGSPAGQSIRVPGELVIRESTAAPKDA